MANVSILEKKKVAVLDLSEKMKGAVSGVFVDYKGITVSDDTSLRKELREAGVEYSVVKNSILERAAQKADFSDFDGLFKGTTAIAISKESFVDPARIICKFSEGKEYFIPKAGFIEGKIISKEEVINLSKLPSKEVLIAKALGSMNAPITGFVNVLSGTIRALVTVLGEIEKKQSA